MRISIKGLRNIVGVAVLIAVPATVTHAAGRPQVDPPGEREAYRALAAGWWQWGWAEGFAQVEDETGELCALNQPDGDVWYLAGTFGVEGVTRTCTVPLGRKLFFPLVNNAFFCPFPNETIDELRAGAAAGLGGDEDDIILSATIDGVPVERLLNRRRPPRLDLLDLRVSSDIFSLEDYPLTLTDIDEDGDGVPEYEDYPCPNVFVSDGAWVLVEPLAAGPHVIEFSASLPADDFSLSVVYFLTVMPGEMPTEVERRGSNVDRARGVERFTQEMLERRLKHRR